MSDTYFMSDPHLGHQGIIKFKRADGSPLRSFATIEEHDEEIIENCNKIVKPSDRLYITGDVVMNRRCLPILSRLNGRKKLIKGNHDIFKLKDYTPFFEDVCAYRIYPKQGIIVSHIPIYAGQLQQRFKWNVHGHLHSNVVTYVEREVVTDIPDPRYINICLEQTNFRPISFGEILVKIGELR